MDHAFFSNASVSAPTPPASPSIGYPQPGNPLIPQVATKLGAWWYHMITEEIRNIIVAAGITPDQTVVSQLLSALRSAGVFVTQLASDNSTKVATTAWAKLGFSISLATNGYIAFPTWLGGLILQWGFCMTPAGGSLVVTRPITFPTAVLAQGCSLYSILVNSPYIVGCDNGSTTQLTVYACTYGGSGISVNIKWYAIGY